MTSPSRGREHNRLRLRIPWMIEIESEGDIAVVGGLLIVGLIVVLVYL
jgi:hypothetical protein